MGYKYFFLDDTQREVWMMGDYVGVCRNAKKDEEFPQKDLVYSIPKYDFYVDFIDNRQADDGSGYENKNSSVADGLTAMQADVVAYELTLAASFINNRKWEI